MHFETNYYDIDLPSDNLRIACVAYAWIIMILNGVLFVITVSIILNYSPATMGAYKWYMIWSQINLFLLHTLLASFEPECLSLKYELVARGVVEYFNMPALGPVLRVSFYVFYEMNVYITVCRFIFRYAQTTGKTVLLSVLSSKAFFIFLFTFFFILSIKAAWLSVNAWADGIEFKKNFPDDNPALKKYILDHTIVIARSNIFEQIFLYIVCPFTLLIGAFCTYQCYRFKKQATIFLSIRTLHMYRVLIHGLVIEQVAEVLWVLIPMVVVHVALEGRQRPLGFFIMIRLFYSYNTFVMIFTLSMYRRYREAVKELFRSLLGTEKLATEVVGTTTF